MFSIVGAGCFTDVPADGTTMIGQTEGEVCPAGTASCPCYGNDTCDAGLSCAEGPNVCVPTGCSPGSEGCVCDDGYACDGVLECEGSVCMPPGESSSSSPDPTTNGMTMSTTSDSDDDDSTTASGSASTTVDPVTSSSMSVGESSTDTTTGDLEDCGELGCGECVTECVVAPGQPCADQEEACSNAGNCLSAAGCMVDCALNGLCTENCCAGLTADHAGLATALNDCRSNNCILTCGQYEDAQCTPTG